MLTWCAREAILKDDRTAWPVPSADAPVLDALWQKRGHFVPATDITALTKLDSIGIQAAVKRLRKKLPLFGCFIIGRNAVFVSPASKFSSGDTSERFAEYRLILDHFSDALSMTATQPAPTANTGAEPVPAAVPDSLGGLKCRCRDSQQNCSDSPR